MTHDQCIDIAVLLLDRCIMPGQSDDDFARLTARYFAVLADLDSTTVKEAIDRMTRNGMQFLPAPGVIFAAARRAQRRQTQIGRALEDMRLLHGGQHLDEDTLDAYVTLLAAVGDDDAVVTAIDRISKGIDSNYERFPTATQIANYASDLVKRRETSLTADQIALRDRKIMDDNREATQQRIQRLIDCNRNKPNAQIKETTDDDRQ